MWGPALGDGKVVSARPGRPVGDGDSIWLVQNAAEVFGVQSIMDLVGNYTRGSNSVQS